MLVELRACVVTIRAVSVKAGGGGDRAAFIGTVVIVIVIVIDGDGEGRSSAPHPAAVRFDSAANVSCRYD